MKIKIETTIELSADDETFRDWYKSTFIACGHQFMDEKICDYGRDAFCEETYGLDDPDRFAKDEDGNTIVVARVGEPK